MKIKVSKCFLFLLHLEQEQSARWKGEQRPPDQRPLGGDEGGGDQDQGARRGLRGHRHRVVERSRRWEVPLMETESVGSTWTLLQGGREAVLGQDAVLQGVGEEDVKEPVLQHRKRSRLASRSTTSETPTVGKGDQVDDYDKEDGEEDADGDRGEVSGLAKWHQAAGLGEGAGLALHQLDGQRGGGAHHLHLVLHPRQDLLQGGQLVGVAVA